MFRAAAAGPYDDIVAKATNENLTSEDWGAIIEVCDRVTGDANGPKEVVQSLIKRLAHRNANVQLYTMEVAHALCQNGGKSVHREVSSRAFTDALLRLANDRNTHQQVKAKILEKMAEWTDMFKADTDLGIMHDAYQKMKQTNPTLQPPSAPTKQGLTESDRQKEEDELQMALKLSLQDEEKTTGGPSGPSGQQAGGSSKADAGGSDRQQEGQAVASGTTAATVSRVRAMYDFVPSEPGELEFKRGDVIAVLESVYKDWWRGSLKGKTGIFPLNYVEKLMDPTPYELQREAQMEQEVFAEIKNVEKLLTLLSATNTAPREEDNEEISKLYHQTLAIRPKLIKLIEKYSQKKDDFTQLNEKFIKARRDYEALLEASMSHPPQQNYHQYAMRPGPPLGYQGGYNQAAPGQDPQRFYNTGPQGHPESPPPNFAPPQQPQGTPAPFYMAGAEVPAAPSEHQYPPRDSQTPLHRQQQQQQPPNGRQPVSPPPQQYQAYSLPAQQQPSDPYQQAPPTQHGQQQRPQSIYSVQELATSVYDSPMAPHEPQRSNTFSSSVYSQEDHNQPSNVPAPYTYQPQGATQTPQYQSYNPSAQASEQPHQQKAPSAPSDGHTYGQAPPPPHGDAMSPPPLQLGGPAYDARHGLPSQGAYAQQQQPQHGGGQAAPQYKAYVPPGGGGDDGGAQDFYRQSAY